jgi:hypothetical protein
MFTITKIGKRIKSEEEQNLCSKHLVTIYKKIHKRKKEALPQEKIHSDEDKNQ